MQSIQFLLVCFSLGPLIVGTGPLNTDYVSYVQFHLSNPCFSTKGCIVLTPPLVGGGVGKLQN